MTVVNPEQAKYEQLWSDDHPTYRGFAPGEAIADEFIKTAKPQPYHSVADFGCGTGRGALRIRQLTGANVRMLDFTSNCLDPQVKSELGEGLSFTQHDLTQPIDERFDYGYCTDVLEHVEPEDVDTVLLNLGKAARRLFLCICTEHDLAGERELGEPLHLTVQDAYWWHEKLKSLNFRVDMSRIPRNGVIFYCSLYATGETFSEISELNVEHDVVRANVRANLALGLQEFAPHQINPDQVVYLLAGGPSLADYEAQIIEAGLNGTPIVTCNGTYNWLIERGVRPAAQVLVDARTFNSRFVTPIIDTCKYLISSQCDNEVLKSLPPEQTWLWHQGNSEIVKEVIEEVSKESGVHREWFPVHSGSTVTTCALTLLAMAGFRKVEVFGWDSCIREDKHHAYSQPENDQKHVVEVKVGNRSFLCHGWMVIQANEFPKVIKHILGQVPDFQMQVHGDGLISHILTHAAELAGRD